MTSHADEKLSFFTSAISAEAAALASKVMEEVQAESQQQMTAAEDEYLNETYRYIKNEVSRLRTEMRRSVSHKMLENKRELHALQQRMFEQSKADVDAKLAQYTATPDYVSALIETLKKIHKAFGNDPIHVYLCARDMDKTAQLQAALPGAELSFFEGSFKLGGLLCQCPAKGWQVDDTFDTRYLALNQRFYALLGSVQPDAE